MYVPPCRSIYYNDYTVGVIQSLDTNFGDNQVV
jgi:hypothetical protein